MSIKFVDYDFNLMDNGDIIFDSDLHSNQIKVSAGDKFEVMLVDGVIVFKKIGTP
jgi:hypothetical protein